MRGLVSGSRLRRALARIVPGGALLGVSAVLLVVMAFPAAASQTHKPKHKGDGTVSVSKAPVRHTWPTAPPSTSSRLRTSAARR